jgi:hypothetical protein
MNDSAKRDIVEDAPRSGSAFAPTGRVQIGALRGQRKNSPKWLAVRSILENPSLPQDDESSTRRGRCQKFDVFEALLDVPLCDGPSADSGPILATIKGDLVRLGFVTTIEVGSEQTCAISANRCATGSRRSKRGACARPRTKPIRKKSHLGKRGVPLLRKAN